MNSQIPANDPIAEMIDKAAEAAAEKAVRDYDQENYEATIKKRKRGKQNEQIKKSRPFR